MAGYQIPAFIFIKKMETKNIQEWYNTFKKGFKIRMVENEHLLGPTFLQTLSVINKPRYVFAGRYRPVIIPSFKVQASGTGKGVADEFGADCLSYMGYKCNYLNTFTEAGVVGSLISNGKGKLFIRKGELGESDFIWIDEARSLIIGNSWSAGLLETINGYLETGTVAKRLAPGWIRYKSNCVFGTGTFFFEQIKPTVLTTGLFQRCNFSYKEYTTKDILRISKKFDELASKDYLLDMKPVLDELKEMKENLHQEQYKGVGGKYVIKINEEESKNFGEKVDNYFQDEIADVFRDKRVVSCMNSFLIRSKALGHKIMTLYSVWNGESEIRNGAGDYALPFVKSHLNSVKELISDMFETTEYDNESLMNYKNKSERIRRTRHAITRVLSVNKGMTKTQFRKYVQQNRGMFSCGELAIIRKIIPEMIEEEILDVEKGVGAEQRLYVKNNKNNGEK